MRYIKFIFLPLIFFNTITEAADIDTVTKQLSIKNNFAEIESGYQTEIKFSDELTLPFSGIKTFTGVGLQIFLKEKTSFFPRLFITEISENESVEDWREILIDEDIEQGYEYLITQLYFAGKESESIRIKIDGNSDDISRINVVFINPGETPEAKKKLIDEKKNEIETKSPLDFDLPPYVSRTEWGCPDGQSSRWNPSYTNVTHLIVHHSATANSEAEWAAVVRTFWTWHAINNGWGDIGYNFLVDPNGVVYEGRAGGNNAIGAHFCGYNGRTMGVCVIGTYTSVKPTDSAIASLVKILTWKSNLEGIDPAGTSYHQSSNKTIKNISGHRDGCATECPGTQLYNYLPSVRNEVKNLLQAKPPFVQSPGYNAEKENHLVYKPIRIEFSAAMDQVSVENSLSISPDSFVSFSWSNSNILNIQPDNHWEFSTAYTVEISDNAESLFGAPLDGDNDEEPGGDYVYKFTTTEPDSQPPYIVKGFPEGEEINILAEMKFVFNEEVDGIIGRVFLKDSANKTVTITDGKIVNEDDITYITFRPRDPLKLNAVYSVILKSGISDFLGNSLDEDIIINFKTMPDEFIGQFIIEDFASVDRWIDPLENDLTENIVPEATSFSANSFKSISPSSSARIIYEFVPGLAGTVGLFMSPPLTFNDSTMLYGVWVYGDLSMNRLMFSLDGNLVEYGAIDWFGWEFVAAPLTDNAYNSFEGLALIKDEAGDVKGELYFDDLQTKSAVTSLNEKIVITGNYELYQNYPNPFNPSTVIKFNLPEKGFVKIWVSNLLGEEVKIISRGIYNQGVHEVVFNAEGLAAGIYFYSIQAGAGGSGFFHTKKFVLLK